METRIPKDAKEQIALIRKLVKEKAPTVSVRNGSGTAWGWVEISGHPLGAMFDEAQKKGLTELGLSYGGNFAVIAPEERVFAIKKWLGVLTEEDHRRAEERAKYRSYD